MAYPRDIPPFWFLLAIGGEVALHCLWPGPRLVDGRWRLLGIGLNVLGLALSAWAAGLFTRAGTGVRPFSEAKVLVAHGPYRCTRNPMYLGMVVMLAGAALALGTATPWVIPPAFAVLIDRRFVVREEAFLTERFGDAYRDFCRRVRRWI